MLMYLIRDLRFKIVPMVMGRYKDKGTAIKRAAQLLGRRPDLAKHIKVFDDNNQVVWER